MAGINVTEWQKQLYTMDIRRRESISFLHGMATMALYDGILSDSEIEALDFWMADNTEFIETWPICDLYKMLKEFQSAAGDLSPERKAIFDLLKQFTTTPDYSPVADDIFDNDAQVIIPKNVFQFTGEFQYGSRDLAKKSVLRLGGRCLDHGHVTQQTDYLVVGDLGSTAWKYKRYGSKIETAKTMKSEGGHILIVQERKFIQAVLDADAAA